MTVAERFWGKVDRGGPTECWIWTGFISPTGYGRSSRGIAHRLAYELTHGPIPEGLTIDHLCRNKACQNPAHLELVTAAENTRRRHRYESRLKTHCPKGHLWAGNTLIDGRGWRRCRSCNAQFYQRWAAARREVAISTLGSTDG